jgi:hypothetical protein
MALQLTPAIFLMCGRGWLYTIIFFFLGGGKENRAGDDEKGNKDGSDCKKM